MCFVHWYIFVIPINSVELWLQTNSLSDVVLDDKVVVLRCLEDKIQSLGLPLGLETKGLRILKDFCIGDHGSIYILHF